MISLNPSEGVWEGEGCAPALSGTALPALRASAGKSRLRKVASTGAANDDPPWPSVCRFNAAVREIRQRYAAARLKLAADEQRELDEADRKFWNGGFDGREG